MKKLRLFPACLLLCLGVGPLGIVAADTEPPAPSFSVAYMDPTVDPRVDFGRYAAGHWYQTTEIPADKSMWGSFNQLEERNRYLIRRVLE